MGCSPWTCKESWMMDWLTHWTEWDWESWEKVLEGRIYRVYTRLSLNWIWRKIRVVSSSSFVFNNRMFWVYHFALYTSCKETVLGGVKKKEAILGKLVHGVAKSDTTEQLHFHFSFPCIGEGNGNPLQCSCLENPRDGGAWWVAVYGVTQSRTRLKWLSSSSSSSPFIYFLDFFFFMWTIFQVFIEFVTVLLLLNVLVFGPEWYGILASWPGIELTPHVLEGEIWTTGSPGKSQ